MDTDVAIIGASPAGLTAALTAARAGARVTLLESKREVGVPEPPAALAFDFLWDSTVSPPADCVRRRLAGVRLASPLDDAHALDVAAPLSILDRTRFDQRLARAAKDAGADVQLGVTNLAVTRVAPDTNGSIRITMGDAGDAHLRPRVVVFADGAATLGRAFLRPTRDPHAIRWGAALEFEHAGAADERYVTIRPGAHAPGGRSQLNPLDGGSERWSHWTFTTGPRAHAEASARAALALEARLRGWPARLATEARLTALAPDPVHTLPRELVADGVMMAGGAAGQGGLEIGVASGEMAGRFAASAALRGQTTKRDLIEYERAWKARYQSGYRALRRAADRLARLDDEAIDRLIAPWSGWRVPVRDIVGLAHHSLPRRAEALAKFAARSPHAVPRAVLTGLRALLSPAAR